MGVTSVQSGDHSSSEDFKGRGVASTSIGYRFK